jgi:hypothetical protein
MTSTWVCLIRIKTNEGLRSHVIDKPSFTIGRTQEADLPILESSVSRLHLGVKVQPDAIYIDDQKSANGTIFNGQPLPPGQVVQVKPGDIVSLGTSGFEFTFISIPKPFEMMDDDSKKGAVMASMEDLAKQIEGRARLQLEGELKHARAELERELRQARADAEKAVVKGSVEAERAITSARGEAEKIVTQTRATAETAVSRARGEALLAQTELQEAKAEANAQLQQMRTTAEKMIRQAELATEQAEAQAKKEIEIIKTQTAVELQNRKQLLEIEMAKVRQNAQLVVTEEKTKARKEADELVAEAQKRIQQDLHDAGKRIEKLLDASQLQSLQMLEDAENKARETITAARDEAGRVRMQVAEESRASQAETIRKSGEALATMQEKLKSQAAEKKAELFEQARLESEKNREQYTKENSTYRESLQAAQRVHEASIAKVGEEVEDLERQKRKVEADFDGIKTELAAARKLLAETASIEKRRAQAEQELKVFQKSREQGLASIERELSEGRDRATKELNEQRERNTVEVEAKKREQESRLAKAQLEAMETIESSVKAEEKKYEQTRRLRALELSQQLNDKLLPKLDTWLADVSTAKLNMKKEIDEAVFESLVKRSSSIVASQSASADVVPIAVQEARDKKLVKYASAVVLILCVAIGFYTTEIYKFLHESQKKSSADMAEKRRIQSVFSPQQTDAYRDNYTDNVIYNRHFYDLKTDQDYETKWTDKLNDITLLKPMGLSEEDVVKYLAKETNLVRRLGVLRGSIDALHAEEGIDRMRNAESEDVNELVTAVKGDFNYRKIRDLETDFYKQFAKSHPRH